MTLFAKWPSHVPNEYTVTYYLDDAGTIYQGPDSLPENQLLTAPPRATLSNHEFVWLVYRAGIYHRLGFRQRPAHRRFELYARGGTTSTLNVVFMNEGSVYERYHDYPLAKPSAPPLSLKRRAISSSGCVHRTSGAFLGF